MVRVRLVFIILCVELVLAFILGLMTLDNSYCDNGQPWRWSYTTQSAQATQTSDTSCGLINVNVQSSEARFYALIIVMVSVPVTAAYGLYYSQNHLKNILKPKPKKSQEIARD